MTRKEAIQKIKELLNFNFNEQPKQEEKIEDAPAPNEEAKVETEEVVPPVEEIKLEATVDVAALQAEIADLKQKVSVLGEYVALKDQYEYLKKCMEQMQAGFQETVNLVEIMASETEESPAQTPKDGVKKSTKEEKLSKYF